MAKSPVEKVAKKILHDYNYNSCLIACLDKDYALHFDFVSSNENARQVNYALTMAMLLASQKELFLNIGGKEEDFWNEIKKGVDCFESGVDIIPK